MGKQTEQKTPQELRELIAAEERKKQDNLAKMREMADENDRIDRKCKKYRKQINDILYPPIQ